MLVLTVAKGPDRGKVFELRGVSRVIIGRNSPDLKLNDIMISRCHAKLKRDGDRWLVRDMGSRNGTKLNGERLVQVAILKAGDHIVTGYTEFEVSFVPDASDLPVLQVKTPETEDDPNLEIEGAASSASIDADQSDPLIDQESNESSPSSIALEEKPASTPDLATQEKSQVDASANEPPQQRDSGELVTDEDLTVKPPAKQEELTEPSDAIQASVQEPGDTDEISAKAESVEADQPAEQGMLNLAPASEAVPENDDASTLLGQQDRASNSSADSPDAPLMERASSEWMTAIESQLVVAQDQGWEDLADDEDDGFIEAVDGGIEPLEDHERSLLYFDEDEHWADDVQLNDDTIVNTLEEDGPQALLKDLQLTPPKSLSSSPLKATTKSRSKGRKKRR